MRTNSKQVRTAIKQHIYDCVYDYDDNLFPTFIDAAKHLYNEFDRVANYGVNLQRIPNNQARFMDYMRGLPFRFHYSSNSIQEYLESLELKPNSKYNEITNNEKAEILYYYLIYSEMIKAINK
jgi:hypothetical protein